MKSNKTGFEGASECVEKNPFFAPRRRCLVQSPLFPTDFPSYVDIAFQAPGAFLSRKFLRSGQVPGILFPEPWKSRTSAYEAVSVTRDFFGRLVPS